MTNTNIFTINDDPVRLTLKRIIQDIDPKTKIYHTYQQLALQYNGAWLDCWPVIRPAIREYLPPHDAMILIHTHADYADITVLTNDCEKTDRHHNLNSEEIRHYAINMARNVLGQPCWTTSFVSKE